MSEPYNIPIAEKFGENRPKEKYLTPVRSLRLSVGRPALETRA